MMSEHQRETAFLRHCLRYDESAEQQVLEEGMTQIQRDERCVRRAVWLMAVFSALAVAGLGYAAVFIESFPQNTSQLIVKIISVLGLASVICLVFFVGLGMVYRTKLDQRREECRQLVIRLLEARLGGPVTTPLPDISAGDGNGGTVLIVAEVNGFPGKTESTAQG